jgi:hypothetical protein
MIHGTDGRGMRNGHSELSEVQALAILIDNGDHRTIAKAYGVNKSQVGDIKCGKEWKHVTRGIINQRGHGRRPKSVQLGKIRTLLGVSS